MPNVKINDITYARVVCTIRETKKDKNITKMSHGGNNMKYEGDADTPTARLETTKMLFNSVLSRKHAKFMTIDMSNFCLMNPMEQHECLRINMKTTPEEIIKEYELEKNKTTDGFMLK